MTPSPARGLDPELRRSLVGYMLRNASPRLTVEAEQALDRMTVGELSALETEMRMATGAPVAFEADYDPFAR